MPIVYACIQPQSPGESERTVAACRAVSQELGAYEPELVVAIAAPPEPHSMIGVSGDAEPAARAGAEAKKDAIPVEAALHIDDRLAGLLREDIEAAAWLWITTARLGLRFHFEFGRALARAIEREERRIALVCLTDLSRTKDARVARTFDEHYRRAVEEWDVKWLVQLDSETRRRAAEDAAAQTAVLMGALSGCRIQPRVVSYEAPEGGGLLVAAIDVLGPRRREEA
jgi:hypothetical protein